MKGYKRDPHWYNGLQLQLFRSKGPNYQKMRFTLAVCLFTLALAGVEATKPAMQAGRLSLQDLLALRNGVILPEISEYFTAADVFISLIARTHETQQ